MSQVTKNPAAAAASGKKQQQDPPSELAKQIEKKKAKAEKKRKAKAQGLFCRSVVNSFLSPVSVLSCAAAVLTQAVFSCANRGAVRLLREGVHRCIRAGGVRRPCDGLHWEGQARLQSPLLQHGA